MISLVAGGETPPYTALQVVLLTVLLEVVLPVLLEVVLPVESSGVAILGSGLVFLLDWGYDTHQTKIIEIHVSKATYMNKDYVHYTYS